MNAFRFGFLFTFLILVQGSTAQELVTFNDLVFTSEFEKRIFEDHFINKKPDYFRLFMASGSLLNESSISAAREKFYAHLASLDQEKVNSKKNDKRIKFLYENIHATFFRKYEEQAQFENVFHNGYFNCVSASAVYSLAFEQLGIPYSIRQKPSHVYLIAYPGSDQIMVEATLPSRGNIAMNDQFKENFVKVLKEQKLIDPQEYARMEIDALFNKYYFGNQADISIPQLIGIQYQNEGIFLMDEKKYKEAYQQFQKAYMFYPSDGLGYLMMVALSSAFNSREQKDIQHATMLAWLSRFSRYSVTPQMVKDEFAAAMQSLLFNRGQKDLITAYYHTLDSLVTPENTRREIGLIYHYETGRYLFNQAKYKEALPYIEKSIEISPENEDALNMMVASLARSLSNRSNSQAIASLEEYGAKYPKLSDHNAFNSMRASCYLVEFALAFESSKPVDGEKKRAVFEDFHKNHSEVTLSSELVGRAYSTAAVYYFRQGNTAKAKTILSKGLQISPDNYELIRRKQMID